MANLNEFAMAKLAREMAMCIRNHNDIFADFGISEEDYYTISKNEFYKRAKEQFSLEWNSTLSAADRVKLISASFAEEVLPVIAGRALDKDEPLVNVLGTFKQLCQNAGIGDPKAEQKPNERFVITINLGSDVEGKPVVEHFDKSIAVDANDISPSPDEIAKDRALAADIKARLVK
jgi:hypothetical protein